MNILLIGSGGREHAIAWALQKSPNTDVLYVAPGNGGTAEIAENVDLDIADGEALLSFVHERNIGLVVIGPEAPLVDGVADLLRADGVPVFGPNADGAQLEGSKAYSKAFMEANDIPTAAYGRFDDEAAALAYVREQGAPIVIKADGLALGKGVIIAQTRDEAKAAVLASEVYEDVAYAGADTTIKNIWKAGDAGYVVEVTPSGFGGNLDVMVGVDNDGVCTGVSIVSHAETSGLGANATKEAWRAQFIGKSGTLAVTKDGGEIEALTGATITSRAVTSGVNSAIAAVAELG